MPYAKNTIKVKVPQRSGFDKSHRNTGTSFTGTLTPLLCDELIPNSRISLRVPISVQLPPLASDTFMNIKYKVEAFFVPMRLLCASFEDFFCDFPRRVFTTNSTTETQVSGTWSDVKAKLPVYRLNSDLTNSVYGPGTLLDYLGFKSEISSGNSFDITPLPLVAYHLIWQEWYRNPRVQNPAFSPTLGHAGNVYNVTSQFGASFLPQLYFHGDFTADGGTAIADNSVLNVNLSGKANFNLADGISIFSLRQRNFGLDYFTGSRVSPQQGDAMSLGIQIPSGTDAAGGSTSFTIAQLRAANSLQQFRERNNIPSPRLVDQVKARYGANLSDGVAQRPICIGSASFDVTSRGVSQTAPGSGTSYNPFSGVANEYGRAQASGNEFLINDFTASEPGYIMVLGSLVPEVTYSSGVRRYLWHYVTDGSITDMACSLLQNVGDQPITDLEIGDVVANAPWRPFGYQDRYSDFMYIPNECHGQMRLNQSLDSFVLQRSIATGSQISDAFLKIPTDYLDNVMATSSELSNLSYWYDSYLQYKVSMPLAEFSIPSLQDPAYEHGESISLRRNGQIF